MIRHVRSVATVVGTVIFMSMMVAGCSSTSGTTATDTGGTANATTTPLSSPTATSAPTTCADLPDFSSAGPFTALTAPANTVDVAGATGGGGSGQWTIQTYSLCSPNSTTSLDVNSGGHGSGELSLFAYLEFVNWGPNHYFPADAVAPSSCSSSSHCYLSLDNTHFLDIDHVKNNGHGLITWRLRTANPPGAPTLCASSFGAEVQDPTGGAATAGQEPPIPLPPLTLAGQGQGAAGNHYLPLCSAGTGASVQAFLAEAMPAFGWQSNGTDAWKQTVGSNLWLVEFGGASMGAPISNAQNWLEDTHPPQPA